ncbi:hypothetical protein GH714_020975 [Hevea brasiliensis]|uniref:Enoyl reductase (ER) domain-containing protein n=1 Tax=Hevea brasiliensis TaxID=3981 RepID=A0A6A6M447_HEVBR|nr:hypothetical protein GH714_020975 [Hevea brasiliensis]
MPLRARLRIARCLHQLQGCAKRRNPLIAKKLHALIIKAGLNESEYLYNTLVDVYGKCGLFQDAYYLFEEMPHRDHVSWASILNAYNHANLPNRTLSIFPTMFALDRLQPDHFVYASLVKACASLGAIRQGKQIHAHFILSPFCDDDVVKSSLVDMSGLKTEAMDLFSRAPLRNLYSWTALISGLVQSGHGIDGSYLFIEMRREGVDIVDPLVLSSVVGACANIAVLEFGKQVHGLVIALGYESCLFISNALVDMYAKCSDILAAKNIFDEIIHKDVVSWTSIIVGAAQHGRADEALALYDDMVLAKVKPNEVTFVGLIYSCSHAGLVSKGRELFKSMTEDYGIKPSLQHFTCLLDLLSRSGCLDEAENLISAMPFEPDEPTWAALLSACKHHGNTQMGLRIANKLLSLNPEDPSTYILLSNIYAGAGMWERMSMVRKLMAAREVKKEPGFSTITFGKEIQAFHAGETCHPMKDEILSLLKELDGEMRRRGYVPDTSSVLHDMEEVEKERQLFWHSERTAVAYGLLKSVPGTVIRIVKNLRVCGDCHTVFKLLSSIVHREIIVRDATSFIQIVVMSVISDKLTIAVYIKNFAVYCMLGFTLAKDVPAFYIFGDSAFYIFGDSVVDVGNNFFIKNKARPVFPNGINFVDISTELVVFCTIIRKRRRNESCPSSFYVINQLLNTPSSKLHLSNPCHVKEQQHLTAAVIWGVGGKLKVEEIQVTTPNSSEVRVKMLCASICHTDVSRAHGFPFVEWWRARNKVNGLKEGDVVIPTFLHSAKNAKIAHHKRLSVPKIPTKPQGSNAMNTPQECPLEAISCTTFLLAPPGLNTCGAAPLVNEALQSTKMGIGKAIAIGSGNAAVTIDFLPLLTGRTLKGSLFGGLTINSDLPYVLDKCKNKEFHLDELLTHEVSLQDIDKAFEMFKQPDCVKTTPQECPLEAISCTTCLLAPHGLNTWLLIPSTLQRLIQLYPALCKFFSCGFSTGFGAAWKEAKVKEGSSVAVLGLGAVGLGAIEGSRMQGAATIIGVDKNSKRREKGQAFGMTHFINPDEFDEPISQLVNDLTGGIGVDYCFECSGAAPLVNEALQSTKMGRGKAMVIGSGHETVTIDFLPLLTGRTLKGSIFGGLTIKSDLPYLLDNCKNKEFHLDELLTHEVSLQDIGKAFDMLKQPDCVKVVVKIH